MCGTGDSLAFALVWIVGDCAAVDCCVGAVASTVLGAAPSSGAAADVADLTALADLARFMAFSARTSPGTALRMRSAVQ